MHRITWDLRAQGATAAPRIAATPAAVAVVAERGGGGGGGRRRRRAAAAAIDEETPAISVGRGFGGGPLVVPGKYTVTLAKRVEGVVTPLAGIADGRSRGRRSLHQEDRVAMAEFQEKLAKMQKALTATTATATEAGTRLDAIRRAIDATPSLPLKLREEGDQARKAARRNQSARSTATASGARTTRACRPRFPSTCRRPPSPTRGTTGRPTKTAMEQYQIASPTGSPSRFRNCASWSRPISRLSKSNSMPRARPHARPPARLEKVGLRGTAGNLVAGACPREILNYAPSGTLNE